MNRFFLFLVLMVFLCTPIESIEISTNISIVKVVSAVLIGFTLITRKNIFVIREPFLIILLVYSVLIFLSFLWSINQLETFKKSLMTIFPNYLVTLIVYFAIKDREDLEKLFIAYVLGCCLVSFISIYMYTTDFQFIEGDEGRVTVFNQDQNELSFLLSFGIVSIIYLLKYSSLGKSAKSLLLLLAVMFTFVVLTTGSRMGLVLLLLIMTTVILMQVKSGRVIILVPVIVVIGLIFVELLPENTTERLFQIKDQIRSHDLTGRVAIWKLALYTFENKNAYILGSGYDTFQTLLSAKTGWAPSSHNTYLCTFIETGVAGLVILLAMIIYLLEKVYYLCRNGSLFFILLLLPLLATMFVLSTNNRRWFFLIGVIIIKLWQFAREEYCNIFSEKGPSELS
jgi:O-antigen ligase